MKELKHVAFILDGNGRWAQEKGMSRSEGHFHGFNNLTKLSKYIFSKGVEVLSVYAFSTENFKRDKAEVDYLMNLFQTAFKTYGKELNKKNIKVVFSGRKEPLPEKVLKMMDEVAEMTKDNTKGIFNVCINYGSQYEILDAVKKINEDVLSGKLNNEDINLDVLNSYMYNELPPVDLMIRTSGENRLSNFMLYQNAYAEFYFPNIYFPAFSEEDFDKAVEVFNNRDRRFGGINKKN